MPSVIRLKLTSRKILQETQVNGPSGDGVEAITRKFGSKLREAREHKHNELRITINGFLVSSLKVSSGSVVFHLRSRIRWLSQSLQAILKWPVLARETQVSNNEAVPLFTVLSQSHYSTRRRAWAWFTVLVSAITIAGFLFLKSNLSTTMTASMLLERADAAEQNTGVDLIRHRFINLEERRNTEGAVVARRRIEIWENRANGNRAQRLYDDSNRLIAGVWQTGNSSRTVYHHGAKPQTQPALAPLEGLLFNLDDVWQLEPSARSFNTLIAESTLTDVEERATTYLLRYEKDRAIGASHLLKATLTVSKSDFRAIEQTLLVQRGNELREYRFAEASFELVPFKAVAPSAFEIEPELTGGAGETGGPGHWAIRDLTSSRVPPSPSTSAPPAASAELEVDVAYLLNQAKADRNEQVALTRSAGGSLRVEGVVDSQARKEEFLRALSPVSANPAVKIDIRTITEATQRTPLAGPAVRVQEAEETSDTVAVEKELRAYFSKRSTAESVDQAVQSYSARVVNRAYRTLFHIIELKRLVERFANVDMRTVAPDARAKWLTMLHDHAAAFASENAALREEIQPVFFPGVVLQDNEDALIQSDADLARVVERLHKLALSNNEAIRSAFTISAQSSASAFKSVGFWQSLQRAENLAGRIRQYKPRRKVIALPINIRNL